MSIWGDIADLFSGFIGGGTTDIAQGASGLPNAVEGWLTSIGGYIASGLEGGIIAVLRDVWQVLLSPFEILVGAVLIISALVFVFKDDITQAAKMAAVFAK